MINLLPPEYSSKIHDTHRNVLLRRWFGVMMLACVGLLLIMGVGWIYIDQQTRNLSHNVASINQQLETQDLSGTQAKAKALTANIKTINQVLSREIRFSDLIKQVGAVMPPGSVLSGLTLTNASGALDLSANARDATSAAQVAVNLSDPKNKLFTKVDIVNINCQSTSPTQYPCTATFKALFSNTTKNQFLNVPGSNK